MPVAGRVNARPGRTRAALGAARRPKVPRSPLAAASVADPGEGEDWRNADTGDHENRWTAGGQAFVPSKFATCPDLGLFTASLV
jgi:hypothetical protein